jgi:tRNA uridine 5-carbamoylmethylation protein Kti12
MSDPVVELECDNTSINTNLVKVSVLLLCGLPGSGKSTLARSIVDHYCRCCSAARGGGPCCFDKVVYIEYDEITNSLLEKKKSSKNDPNNNDNNNNNNNSTIVMTTMGRREELTLVDLEAWRETRSEALRLFQNELELATSYSQTRSSDSTCCNHQLSTFPMPYRLLIVMDDNFHLRSMRRNVYKICQSILHGSHSQDDVNLQGQTLRQEIQIGFVIIYVNTSLDKCIENNEKRIGTKRYIPQRIITNMYHNMEPPNGEKVHFERLSIDTFTFEVDHTCPSSMFYQHLESLLEQDSVVPCLDPSMTKDLEAMEQDRLATLKSTMHRIDLILRSMVGIVCQINKKYGKYANHARKIILTECREGSLNTLFSRPWHCDDDDYYCNDQQENHVAINRNVQDWLKKRYEEILLEDIVDLCDRKEIHAAIQKALFVVHKKRRWTFQYQPTCPI